MGFIRNENGLWINSKVFSEAAQEFLNTGRYCHDLPGTMGYDRFWDQEWTRCTEGHTVGGATITGQHYFYLNYCPIERVILDKKVNKGLINSKAVRKKVTFPDFYDGDYNYFHIRNIAAFGSTVEEVEKLKLDINIFPSELEGGKHLIVGKARRKGFSFKNGSLATHEYTFNRGSLTLLCAYDKKYLYPQGIMTMAVSYSDFINENTDFGKRRLINKKEHIKSGYKENINGVEVEKGYKSQILSLTFSDNPDAARGKSGSLVLMEEVGDWNDMKSAYAAIRPTVQAGAYVTGQIILFGTGGDATGSTVDFMDMFGNPEPYNLMAFSNIWDENCSHKTCGYFYPVHQNMEGYIDSQGNSLKDKAIEAEQKERLRIAATAKDKNTLTKYCTEFPFGPAEAFAISRGNVFPVPDLLKQLSFVESSLDSSIKGTKGILVLNENGKIEFQPDLANRLMQSEFPTKENSIEGCVMIWEPPVESPPYGLYISGVDPYTHSTTNSSPSVGSTYVMKRASAGLASQDLIVAEYCGRPANLKEYNENVRRLLMYYGVVGTCLYENNVNNLKEYFETKNSLHLLAKSPSILKAAVAGHLTNQYGIRMSKQIKDELEIYLRDWLLEEVEDGKCNLHFIYSAPLIKELIQYNDEGNFDRCFTEDTLILTALGYKQIKDIQVGDQVLTHKGRFKNVTCTSEHLPEDPELLDIRVCSSNEHLKMTKNHPILIKRIKRNGRRKHLVTREFENQEAFWVKGKELQKNDLVLFPKRKNLVKTELSDDLLYLLGWYLSDGCIGKNNNSLRICFQGDQMEMAVKIKYIIDKFIEDEVPYNNRKKTKARLYWDQQGKNCIYVEKHSVKLKNFILTYCGGANDKYIKQELFNKSGLMSLVVGYLEGDGHQKIDKHGRNTIECPSIYFDLSKQIRQILLDNGVYSSICIKNKNSERKLQMNLNITGKHVLKIVEQSLKFTNSEIKTYNKDFGFEDESGFWVPVKSIESFNHEGYVYNFSVEEDETYVASNIVVHNCISMMLVICQKLQMHRIIAQKKEEIKIDEFFARKYFSK